MNNVSKWVQSVNSTLRRGSSTGATPGAATNGAPPGYNQSWLHNPDDLTGAYVQYIVKFMGDVAVEEPKGTHVIKDAIRRLRFQWDWKRSQGAWKLPKVELHVSVQGVKMVDPKNGMVLHTHPLHRISFCADDKHDKRLFAFIAKQQTKQRPDNLAPGPMAACSGLLDEENRCFVFLSDRLSEHITLTIGQAFDLAYRQFLDSNKNGNDHEACNDSQLRKLVNLLRNRIKELERENEGLKQKLAQQQRRKAKNSDEFHRQVDSPVQPEHENLHNLRKTAWENFDSSSLSIFPSLPSSPVPPPPQGWVSNTPQPISLLDLAPLDLTPKSSIPDAKTTGLPVGNHAEEGSSVFDSNFDPRAGESDFRRIQEGTSSSDGSPEKTCEEQALEIQRRDALLAEMRDGYRRGLAIGRTDLEVDAAGSFDDAATPSAPVRGSGVDRHARQNST